nr:serine/threonine-protein kinase HT1-like [Tanacetum cinerariifolium]
MQKRLFRSLESHESNNLQKSHRDLVVRQKQKPQQPEWVETIDPSKLLLGNVIGRGSFGVVHKGSYHSQTVAGTIAKQLQVLSRKPYSHKCDVYAFGICLWEIQCCDMAYTYDLENIPSDIYKELRPSIPLDCPRPLAKLMERCWNTDPSK